MISDALAVGPDRTLIALLALLLDAAIGDPPGFYRWVPHPRHILDRLARQLERRLDRDFRSTRTRHVRGVMSIVAFGGCGAAVGWLIASAGLPFAWFVELIVLTMLLGQGALWRNARRAAAVIETGDQPAAAKLVGDFADGAVDQRDLHGLARWVVEHGAFAFVSSVVSIAFWYILLGLPGVLAMAAMRALRPSGPIPPGGSFGEAAARLDDALQFLPSIIAAGFIIVASVFAPAARPWRAVTTVFCTRHPSPIGGRPEAALAGALNLALGGPSRGHGATAWVGTGRAKVVPADIRRAAFILVVAHLLLVGVIAALTLAQRALI